jgi:hypothetical protein
MFTALLRLGSVKLCYYSQCDIQLKTPKTLLVVGLLFLSYTLLVSKLNYFIVSTAQSCRKLEHKSVQIIFHIKK